MNCSFSYTNFGWNGCNTRDSFSPNIVTFSDYYPFGMEIKDLSSNSSEYRYGMNGQEKIDEVSGQGNSYTAEFWQYDTRLARRWNIDPVVKDWLSGYSAFRNSPIIFADPNGDDDVFTNSKSGESTIIKTKDDFDRKFVDGKQVGDNLPKGWGMDKYKDARVFDLSPVWKKEYLYEKDRIIGLAAYTSNRVFDYKKDTETQAASLDVGIVDFRGGTEFSFYQTMKTDYDPVDKNHDNKFDGNDRGIYPDERTTSGCNNDTGIPFDLYMGDIPNRSGYRTPNMNWKAYTSIIYKQKDGNVKKLTTITWGFKIKDYKVTRQWARKTNHPSQFHLENIPKDGDITPNN